MAATHAARDYQSGLELVTVDIANGASLSDATNLKGKTVVGLITPAAWTAAAISFDVASDLGTTFYPLYWTESGVTAEVKIAQADVAASRFYALPAAPFLGCHQVKVRSGLNGSVTVQGGARTVTLVVRAL